jgi:hypothetical protein
VKAYSATSATGSCGIARIGSEIQYLPAVLAKIDPSLLPLPQHLFASAAPAPVTVSQVTSTSELRDGTDKMGTIVSIYKAIARRLTRKIIGEQKTDIEHPDTVRRFAALVGWKLYWEDCADYRVVFARRGGRTTACAESVYSRFRELISGTPIDNIAEYECGHLMVATALGTFAEALTLAEKYNEAGKAGRIAREISGAQIPLIVSQGPSDRSGKTTLYRREAADLKTIDALFRR